MVYLDHGKSFLDAFFQNGHEVSSVSRRTVGTNFSLFTRQDIHLTHLDHGHCEVIKKQLLIDGKTLHNTTCSLVHEQILVGCEQSLSVHEINVVLVVENVRAPYVVHLRVVRVCSGTSAFEVVGECFVHGWVLVRVKPVRERRTMRNSNGVTTRKCN